MIEKKLLLGLVKDARVFPRPFRHGEICPPHMRGQSDNGGAHEGDINIMGGPSFKRLYDKPKVLLLLLLLLLCY